MIATFCIFALAVYGLANAIAVLKFGKPLRAWLESRENLANGKLLKLFWAFWGAFVKCPPCLAFWIGMVFSIWILSPASSLGIAQWKPVLVDGLAASGATYLLHLVAEKLGDGLDV